MLNSIISLLGKSNKTKTTIKVILVGGFLSVIVRIIGFVKESAVAYFFGVSEFVDFYVLGMLFVLFFVQPVGGALATLLTQKFIEYTQHNSKEFTKHLYLNCLIFGIICICMILIIQGCVLQISFFDTWFNNRFKNINLNYIYILIPIGLFSLISVINGSVLVALRKFKTFTFLPIIIHLSTITFLLFTPKKYLFEGLLIGTLIGFLLELLISKICLYDILKKLKPRFFKEKNKDFKKIIKSMPNMVLSGSIISGCLIVDQVMALLAGDGAVAMINFGNRIPLGIISLIAIIWTVLYPNFVKSASTSDYVSLRKDLVLFSSLSFLLLLPICVGLSFFSKDLISVLFEHGAFLEKNTIVVSNILTLYLLFIPLFVVSMLCIRVINALEKPNIFLLGSFLLLIINISLNFYLIPLYGVIGAPLATLISYIIITTFWISITHWLLKLPN